MSQSKSRYVNPLTDFGFRKIFGEEYDRIFEELAEVVEINDLTAGERRAYEESIKYYRDIKNVVDTSREEGWKEGREEASEQRALTIARRLLSAGVGVEQVAEFTGLALQRVEALQNYRSQKKRSTYAREAGFWGVLILLATRPDAQRSQALTSGAPTPNDASARDASRSLPIAAFLTRRAKRAGPPLTP